MSGDMAKLMNGNPMMDMFAPIIEQATAGAAAFERKVMAALADIRAQQEAMLELMRREI